MGDEITCDYGGSAAAQSLFNESSTSNDNGGGHAVVFVMVGLLGAAMIALKVVKSRHSVAIRRNQYSEIDATAAIQVWSRGKQYSSIILQ